MGVLVGLAAGALAATILGLFLWPVLALLGVDRAPLAGLTLGVLGGLVSAGFVAGRMALTAPRFNGSVAGLGLAGLVVVVARLGGSPAPTGQVLWLALIAVALGGVGGVVGGRRAGKKHSS